ncbi:MAG TPA: ABC transporter permease [Vicinamibacterales bacterium]|jgi:NitT/TauT family transport system permease protein|nr:ABC transporter permease [Vicinamibacterales bacterium]
MSGVAERRSRLIVWQLALAATVLLVWEWAAASNVLDPFFFSRPSDVVLRMAQWIGTGSLWVHLSTTFSEAILSFVIGGSLGVLLGFALAGVPILAALLEPYLRIANALPRVVLAPIFLLWFGLGIWSKVALGVTVVFFIVFFNTYRGVREVDRVVIDNARMLGASQAQLVRHVLIPSALTWIFASLHISIGMAIIAVVVGEYLGSSRGIGYLIAQAEGVFDTTGVFAGMAVLAAGVLLVGDLVSRLERRLLRWKPEHAESRSSEWLGSLARLKS